MSQRKTFSLLVCTIFLFSPLLFPAVMGCKDIVITPVATAGDYSLFLKVRDPSRAGLQVLCRVPQGAHYTYHYPWTGRPWEFTVAHTFFGVASQGDILPNIVKAGMAFTDAGLAFGDADTLSNWRNPTKNAWDDFDWMRYAYQTANSEDEATTLLTTDAIDHLHATGVPENLLVVGPNKAVVIEADAVRYSIKEIPDVLIMSNYPKDLWRTQVLISRPIASSYDATVEPWVRQGRIVHLGSLCGVKIMRITPSSVTLKAVPSFVFRPYGLDGDVTLQLGERATVGLYSVTLLDINGPTVKISVCTANYAWEQALLARIQPMIGQITLQEMMGWSRLHSAELNGLRPVCEDANTDETAMIYRVPQDHASLLSSGWFAANHPCASIYVPVHICDNNVYEPYQTGEAAALSLDLLHQYGHGTLTPYCQGIEAVFIGENEVNELIARIMIQNNLNIMSFLTAMDVGMQEQAFLTEQLWHSIPNTTQGTIKDMWQRNYSTSLENMEKAVVSLQKNGKSDDSITLIEAIALSIGNTRMKAASLIGISNPSAQQDVTIAHLCFTLGEHTKGFTFLEHAVHSLQFSERILHRP